MKSKAQLSLEQHGTPHRPESYPSGRVSKSRQSLHDRSFDQYGNMRSKYLFSPVDPAESRRTFFLLATKGSMSLFEIEKKAYLLWWLLFLPAYAGGLFIAIVIAILFGPFVGWSPALFSILILGALLLVPTKTWSWTGQIAFHYNQNLGANGLPVNVLETRLGRSFNHRLRIEAGGRERTLLLTSRRGTLDSALELVRAPRQ